MLNDEMLNDRTRIPFPIWPCANILFSLGRLVTTVIDHDVKLAHQLMTHHGVDLNHFQLKISVRIPTQILS